MSFSRQLKVALSRPFFSLVARQKGLVVVTLHNIKSTDFEWFSQLIEFIDNNFGIMSDSSETKVILTFDDGFLSNVILADKVLSKYGVKALFFITEGFIGLDNDDAFQFAQQYFYPNSHLSDNLKSECKAMSWEDVRFLVAQGHTIGAHTRTHPVLSSLTEHECRDEIINSADRLEKRINQQINYFAFPFGTPEVVARNIIKMSTDRFDFVFSNVRGGIKDSPGNHFLFRQNLVLGDPFWLVKAMIEGRLDWLYRKSQQLAHSKFLKP